MERIIINLRVLLLESQGSTNECQAESLKGISENCKKQKQKQKKKIKKQQQCFVLLYGCCKHHTP